MKVENSISKCLRCDNGVEWREFLVYDGHLFVVETHPIYP